MYGIESSCFSIEVTEKHVATSYSISGAFKRFSKTAKLHHVKAPTVSSKVFNC